MSAMYMTSQGLRVILRAPLPDSEFMSSDVRRYQLTEIGQAKVGNGIPIRELERDIDLVLIEVLRFRPTENSLFRDGLSYGRNLELSAQYRESQKRI